ncbi:hypothetical protein BYT27DRAFT_7191158 [Phlegmacium glaucopus]|nr:hypothetical protein BYT27DRAFT_7191158 [Phlegmacium glaucopus]
MVPPTPTSSKDRKSPLNPLDDAGAKTQGLFGDLKQPLQRLNDAFDGLPDQTTQMASLAGAVGTKLEIIDLHEQLKNQDQRHKAAIEEIQGILDGLLQSEVLANIKKEVDREIAEQMDKLVQEGVTKCLKTHIPQELQDEVAVSKGELKKVRLALHDSESRRANANLRISKKEDPLGTIHMTDDTVSRHYPKDLESLFSLDAETTKALMSDYNLHNSDSDSQDHNLNRFMHFCGIQYQLVRR